MKVKGGCFATTLSCLFMSLDRNNNYNHNYGDYYENSHYQTAFLLASFTLKKFNTMIFKAKIFYTVVISFILQ